MANKKISELPSATTPLAGTEELEIVQGGINKKVAASDVGSGGGTWGSITGTLSSQTDLQSALDAKQTAAQVQTIADAKVADAINDGTTTIAPSQNAVFDALALKADITYVDSSIAATNTATRLFMYNNFI